MTKNIQEASLTELDNMKEAIDNLETAMKKVKTENAAPKLPNMYNTVLLTLKLSTLTKS